ncbi:uncharacterized protein L199_003750 [Kwoniella botswanensis]|uniref:uncharacterized protein n=1 Tax=Kwoniella botswanensis TaxID=1268659 RepID=UPI00315D1AD8
MSTPTQTPPFRTRSLTSTVHSNSSPSTKTSTPSRPNQPLHRRKLLLHIDFINLYWVIRYLNTNSLTFSKDLNVRSTMTKRSLEIERGSRIISFPSFSGLRHSPFSKGGWDWHDISSDGEQEESEVYNGLENKTVKFVSSESTSTAESVTSASGTIPNSASTRRVSSESSTTTSTSRFSTKDNPTRTTSRSHLHSQEDHPPLSSLLASRSEPHIQSQPDPHPRPTPIPPSADALVIYIAADKYRLDILRGLAKEHILKYLDEVNCIPLEFASYSYDELHSEVLDYMVGGSWNQVKSSKEFLKCIQEVRQDVWGVNGPMVLHNIYMKL